MDTNKDVISKAPSGRVTRTPVGTRNILTVKGKDPNYEYRIVNDIDDRVTQFQEAGYELVANETVKVGDKRVNSATSEGSVKQLFCWSRQRYSDGKRFIVSKIGKKELLTFYMICIMTGRILWKYNSGNHKPHDGGVS